MYCQSPKNARLFSVLSLLLIAQTCTQKKKNLKIKSWIIFWVKIFFAFFPFFQYSPLICGLIFYVCGFFSALSFYHFWSKSPCILQQLKCIFEGARFCRFNKFHSLVCLCIVIHHHRPQMQTLFRRVRWHLTGVQCDVRKDTKPPVLSPIREDQVMYR